MAKAPKIITVTLPVLPPRSHLLVTLERSSGPCPPRIDTLCALALITGGKISGEKVPQPLHKVLQVVAEPLECELSSPLKYQ